MPAAADTSVVSGEYKNFSNGWALQASSTF